MSIRKVYEDIKKTLVQEDNPNSPHTVIGRMNDNILSKSDDTPAKPHIFSRKAFDAIVWGEEGEE